MSDIQAVQKQLESFRSAQERLNTITQQLQQTLDSGEMRIKMSAILEMLAASQGLIGQGSALVAALGAAEQEKTEASAKKPVAKKTVAKAALKKVESLASEARAEEKPAVKAPAKKAKKSASKKAQAKVEEKPVVKVPAKKASVAKKK